MNDPIEELRRHQRQLSDAEIRELLHDYEQQIAALELRAVNLVKGRKVRIVGDWNGQPYGSSKPSRTGKVFTATGVSLSGHQPYGSWSGVQVEEHPYDAPPYLRDVEFL